MYLGIPMCTQVEQTNTVRFTGHLVVATYAGSFTGAGIVGGGISRL